MLVCMFQSSSAKHQRLISCYYFWIYQTVAVCTVPPYDFLYLFFLISIRLSSLALSCCLSSIIQWEASGRVYAWKATMYGIVSSVVLLLSNPRTQTWLCGSLRTSTAWPSSHYCGQELPGNLNFVRWYDSNIYSHDSTASMCLCFCHISGQVRGNEIFLIS